MRAQGQALPGCQWASLSRRNLEERRQWDKVQPLLLHVVSGLQTILILREISLIFAITSAGLSDFAGDVITQILVLEGFEPLTTIPFSGPCLLTITAGQGSPRMGVLLAVGQDISHRVGVTCT